MSDRVLLTGVSGFLGGHVALQLLAAGYVVRGSVRDLRKADKVQSTLAGAGADVSRLEFVALDLMSDGGWSEAMDGVRYLQHVASPFVTSMPSDKMELIRPAVEGTKRALEAAFAAGVERVVLTSSMAAIAYGHDQARTAPFTGDDWTKLDGHGVNAYVESKARAERAAWDIAERHGRKQDLAVVNPSAILGPLLDEDPGTSAALVQRLLNGSVPAAPNFAFAVPAHARKLPKFQAPDWLVRIIGLFDRDVRGNLGELGVVKRLDSSAATSLLGRPLIPAEDALAATARSLVAQGLI